MRDFHKRNDAIIKKKHLFNIKFIDVLKDKVRQEEKSKLDKLKRGDYTSKNITQKQQKIYHRLIDNAITKLNKSEIDNMYEKIIFSEVLQELESALNEYINGFLEKMNIDSMNLLLQSVNEFENDHIELLAKNLRRDK